MTGRCGASVAERPENVWPGRAQGGEQAEGQPGDDRGSDGEQQHNDVHADRLDLAHGLGDEHSKDATPGDAKPEANRAASNGEQTIFSEQLANDARLPSAKRSANRDLAPAAGAANEQQIREVDASDE